MKKVILLLVSTIVICMIYGCSNVSQTAIKNEGKLCEILNIQYDDIQSVAIKNFHSTRATDSRIDIEKVFLLLDQEVSLSNVFNRKKPSSGEADYQIYLFLNTGKYIKIGVDEDGVVFGKGNKQYSYLGRFEIEPFNELPLIENPTKFWNEKNVYEEW